MDKNEGMDFIQAVLGNQPSSDPQHLFINPYTLEDFRNFYDKVCSQLKASESELLFKLSKSSESDLMSHSNLIGSLGRDWHPDLPRPFEVKAVNEAKKNYLRGLLCGASIDYLEVVSDEFRLIPLDAKLIGNDNFMLFMSRYWKDGSARTHDDIFKVYDEMSPGAPHSGSYVTHHVDKNDYALVGKMLPEDEYRKRLHDWELDVNWD